ncbi:MAG: glycosyltransferase family 1 protein [bacterium]
MRIGIDARPLTKKFKSGICVYLENIIRCLSNSLRDKEDCVFYLYAHRPFYLPNLGENFKLVLDNVNLPGTIWVQTKLPYLINKDKIDIFWGTQQVLPIFNVNKRVKMLLTVNDLIYKRFPETMEVINYWINILLTPVSIKKSDQIIAISKNTANDLGYYYPKNKKPVKVIYAGVTNEFVCLEAAAAKRYVHKKFKIELPYILVLGTQEPRKNFITAFKAFIQVSKRFPHLLVSVGYPGWKIKAILEEIKRSSLAERVIFLDYVKKDDLPFLYSAAEVFLFPSLYEGFGIPPLEAMACGCPVISSNAASLPEVIGKAGILLPPEEICLWDDSISRVLSNKSLSRKLKQDGMEQAKKFSWEKSTAELWDLFFRL